MEFASKGINVSAIAPGLIQTEKTGDLYAGAGRSTYANCISIGDYNQADEVAASAILADLGVRLICGDTINMDGG